MRYEKKSEDELREMTKKRFASSKLVDRLQKNKAER